MKFKVQFYVIVILTSIATMILSISLSASSRIKQNYDSITSKMDKFDYITSREVGSQSTKDPKMVPLVDFIDSQALTVNYLNKGLEDPLNEGLSYNFNLIDSSKFSNLDSFKDLKDLTRNDYLNSYQKTFISTAFDSQEVQNAMFDLFANDNYLEPFFHYEYNYEKDSVTYKTNYDKYNQGVMNGSLMFRDVRSTGSSRFNNFATVAMNNMVTSFLEDLFNYNGVEGQSAPYLKTSAFYKLKNLGLIKKDDFSLDFDNNQNKYQIYMITAFNTVLTSVINNANEYLSNFIDQAVVKIADKSNDSPKEQLAKEFNANFADLAGFEFYENNKNNKEIAEVLYEFIMGSKHNSQTASKKASDFVVQGNNLAWVEKVNYGTGDKEYFDKNLLLNNRDNKYAYGNRGSLIQIVAPFDADGNLPSRIGRTNGQKLLQLEDAKLSISQVLAHFVGFEDYADRDNVTFQNVNNIRTFYLRNQILGNATQFRVEQRAEISLTDSTKEMKYRMVVLDDLWRERLSIVDGRAPLSNDEMVINPQYANKNKIKIGQRLSVGGAEFTITGFASDPLTYYPVSDENTFLPNSRKSLILYADMEVINKIFTDDFRKFASRSVYTILTAKDGVNAEVAKKDYESLQMQSVKDIPQFLNVKNKISNGEDAPNVAIRSGEELSSFEDSNLKYNWVVAPKIIFIFNLFSGIASSVIAAIALYAMILAVKKTIELNSGEIAILKAMGVKTSLISLSYISYGLITTFVVVPVSWLAAMFLQEIIVQIFLSYMTGSYLNIFFDYLPFLLAVMLFGVLSIIISYIVAISLNKKPVIEILNKKEKVKRYELIDKIKNSMTSRMSFSKRFSTELAFSGFSKTLLTGVTIFISTFFVTLCLAIPGVIQQTVGSYYKNVKYANSVENIELLGNAPLSKTALSPWQGVEYYEDKYTDSNGIFGTSFSKIANSISSNMSIQDNSVLPTLVMGEKDGSINYNWYYNAVLNHTDEGNVVSSEEDNNLISVISSTFGNNISELLGKGISIGEIQKIIEMIIHSTDERFDNFEDRKLKITQISDFLTNGLPDILKNVIGNEAQLSGNWKDQIIEIISSDVPSYIKNYLNISENRYNQYKFGWTFNTYIPGVDTLYTSIKGNANGEHIQITGLPSDQTAFNISNNEKKIFGSEYQYRQIENILHGTGEAKDIVINGEKVYDASKRELNIPMIVNGEAIRNYNITDNLINNLDVNAKRILISENGMNIPNSAWMYDDSDYVNYATGNEKLKSSIIKSNYVDKHWLNPADLQTSKFTFQPIFNYKDGGYTQGFNRGKNVSKIMNDSFAFYDIQSSYDSNGEEKLEAQIRPYYQYDNVMLFIPKELGAKFDNIANVGSVKNRDTFYGQVKASEVPETTRNDWNATLGKNVSDYIWIRPYSKYFDPSDTYYKTEENLQGDEAGELVNAKLGYLQAAFTSSDNPFKLEDVSMDWKTLSNGNVQKINLVKKGELKIYGSDLLIVDQDLANLINGYSIQKYIPFDSTPEDWNNPNNGSYTQNGVKINTYNLKTPERLITERSGTDYVYGLNDEQKSYRPNAWYNGVYSTASEPYYITTQISTTKNPRIGEDKLNGSSAFTSLVEMKDQVFLSEQRNLINQIENLVMTIGVFFIAFVIIVSTLSIILITDLYVNQYKKFMLVLKSLGYSNLEIIKYTFGFTSVFSTMTFLIGSALSYLTIFGLVSIINKKVMSIPYGITWWSPFMAAMIIISCFVVAIVITTRKIRKESPTVITS
ncbi:ABC transporter permease [Spiroplasma chinense]|nr:ABC transporter permease [Spiroplasma chinense]